MKGDFKTKVGIYRKCPKCGRNFPAFSCGNPHDRIICNPCMRRLGMPIDGEEK